MSSQAPDTPNPRPRQQQRRDDRDVEMAMPSREQPHAPPQSVNPPQQPGYQQGSQQPVPDLAGLFQNMMIAQQQQFMQLMNQQAQFQHQLLHQNGRKPKRGDPPTFGGAPKEDVELWIFNTEQYYADQEQLMVQQDSQFTQMIFANLEAAAQTWYRDLKLSRAEGEPVTWSFFKDRIRDRDRDYQYKLLTKLHRLRFSGSQQDYTNQFLHLLSQLGEEKPDFVKRWLYQQNLRSQTSAFISQNIPNTFQDVMELAIRFESTQPPLTNQESGKGGNRNPSQNQNTGWCEDPRPRA